MLDPEADCEGLVLHEDVFFRQELVNIPRGMAGCEDGGVPGKFASVRGGNPSDAASCDQQVVYFCLEMDFATVGDDGLADGFYDVWQEVRSDVRVGIGEDLIRRTVGDEDAVDFRDGAALRGAGVELPVGKSARAALAEAVVRFLDDAAFAKDGREIETPCGGVLAALQNYGLLAQLQAPQCREQTRRPRADDDHAFRIFRESWS